MQALFLLLFFLDSVGDSLFLTGVPLYLYKLGVASTSRSLLLLLAITFGTLISKKLILKLSEYNPFLVVGVGEVIVALVEFFLFFIIDKNSSAYSLFIGTVIIAMIYNLYAGLKYFHLFPILAKPKELQKIISMQSIAYRAGLICGAAASGVILEKFGIGNLMLIDAFTFGLFGVSCVLAYFFMDNNPSVEKITTNQIQQEHDVLLGKSKLHYIFILLIFGSIFVSWEQASASAIVVSYTALSFSKVTVIRGLSTLCALGLFFLVSKYRGNRLFYYYVASLSCLLLLLLGDFLIGNVNWFALFITALCSMVTPYIIPVQTRLINFFGNNTKETKKFTAEFWIVLSVVKLCLFPVNILRDNYNITVGQYFMVLFLVLLVCSFMCFKYLKRRYSWI